MECKFHLKQQCKIYIGSSLELLPEVVPAGRVIVISDTNVDRLRHDILLGYETILLGSGETLKTLATVELIIRRLVDMGADRSTFLLGVGGGVVSDITGFVASIYMRGVDFGFVPTTFLGQVDAAIGGKNGVNIDGYKNMVGTFNQPSFVICDPTLLRTLPDREFRAGLVEVIKAGVLADANLFARVEAVGYRQLRNDVELLSQIVYEALAVKTTIVEHDERECGQRRRLNLGHTLGHAIEKCSMHVNHGEAVAVGMALITNAALRLRLISEGDCRRILALLEHVGFVLESPVEIKRLLKAVVKDKKMDNGELHVVFPTGIGSCCVRRMTHEEFVAMFV